MIVLMSRAVVADGAVRDSREILRIAALSALLSDEGVMEVGGDLGGPR
jgi:hypothetical protein